MAAITTAELGLYFSTATGSAGNTTPGNAAGSLGKYVSTTPWGNGATLFDDISGAENAAGTVDYRCVVVANLNGFNAWEAASVYISAKASGGAAIALAVDPTAATPRGSGSAQTLTAASETAPGTSVANLAYSSPTTAGAAVPLGTIPAGYCRGIWVRRTCTNSAALSNDTVSLTLSGDTGSL